MKTRIGGADLTEEYEFMVKLLGVPATVYRLSDAYGCTPAHVVRTVRAHGSDVYIDNRSVAA